MQVRKALLELSHRGDRGGKFGSHLFRLLSGRRKLVFKLGDMDLRRLQLAGGLAETRFELLNLSHSHGEFIAQVARLKRGSFSDISSFLKGRFGHLFLLAKS